jgi:branched-chain amino acid transport system substrate-binding protein
MKRVIVWVSLMLTSMAACSWRAKPLPPAPPHVFRRAEDLLARGDLEHAAAAYRQFLASSQPVEAYVPRAHYQLALTEFRAMQYSAALATLATLSERYPEQKWVQVETLRGDAQVGLGQRAAALMAWQDAWELARPVEREHLRKRIEAAVHAMSEQELVEADRVLVHAEVRELAGLGDLMQAAPMPSIEIVDAEEAAEVEEDVDAGEEEWAEAEEGVEAGEQTAEAEGEDGVEAEETAEAAVTIEPGVELVAPEINAEPETELAPLEQPRPAAAAAVDQPPAAPSVFQPGIRVACLLPLTGSDNAYGHRALAGLRLAFDDAPEQLLVRDTGGDPDVGLKLLSGLDSDPTVVAVIGPLRSSEAEVAAPLAEREQIPLLLLSQREGLGGRFVLQLATTRTQQADLLVRYGVNELKLRRFAVVHPDDGYGSSFAQAFKDAVAAQGAAIAGVLAYEPGEPDMEEIAASARRWLSPGVDAVFVPDGARVAAAVAAQIRGELPAVTLLGTESWNDAAALAEVGASIDGALFADAFFAGSTRPSTREFVERFERGTGRSPTVFEAQAFDAGLVVRRALAAGATTRDQVVTTLMSLGSTEGAGELRSSPSGFQRSLSLLRFRDGQIEEIVSAGTG